ncbi:hypothetical protein TL16_g10537 [Triparma laevis f. inornata]|uniref:Coenzyme PQQ synthesis protein F-like C-terminal lobe domain-containing protein n=1 Tax=Triparma laevis f. inornata TaxID=1714386 RepID=A0A9W7EPV7_9STRA|nr:hypothetical protein TL16_g10537 [Triparma laevis f. inornata]
MSERVEAFLVTFRQKITDMEEIEFGENKQAVIDKLLEKDKNLSEESYRYFAQINKGMYVFEKSKLMADVVEGMDKASILKFFDAFLAAGGEKVRNCEEQIDEH